MLGSNPVLLLLRHWHSDALPRLDLITVIFYRVNIELGLLHYCNLDALNPRLPRVHPQMCQVSAGDDCLRLYLPLCQEAGHSPSQVS
jgi:hypothetical protein